MTNSIRHFQSKPYVQPRINTHILFSYRTGETDCDIYWSDILVVRLIPRVRPLVNNLDSPDSEYEWILKSENRGFSRLCWITVFACCHRLSWSPLKIKIMIFFFCYLWLHEYFPGHGIQVTRLPGPGLDTKTVFPRYGIPMLKIRRSRYL